MSKIASWVYSPQVNTGGMNTSCAKHKALLITYYTHTTNIVSDSFKWNVQLEIVFFWGDPISTLNQILGNQHASLTVDCEIKGLTLNDSLKSQGNISWGRQQSLSVFAAESFLSRVGWQCIIPRASSYLCTSYNQIIPPNFLYLC